MNKLHHLLRQLHEDEDAVTTTEYVMILVLIGCASLAAVKLFSRTVSGKYSDANGTEYEVVTLEQ